MNKPKYELEIIGYDSNSKELIAKTDDGEEIGVDPFLRELWEISRRNFKGRVLVTGHYKMMPIRPLLIAETIEEC